MRLPFSLPTGELVDDLNDAAGLRVNHYRTLVEHRVIILGIHTHIRRNRVRAYRPRQRRSHDDLVLNVGRWCALRHHILLDPSRLRGRKGPARNGTDCSAESSPNRTTNDRTGHSTRRQTRTCTSGLISRLRMSTKRKADGGNNSDRK